MGHPNIKALTLKTMALLGGETYLMVIYIPKNNLQWLEGFQSINDRLIADISCVPYFITSGEMAENRLIQKAVSV